MERMTNCIKKYLSKDTHYDVLDFGSWASKQTINHRQLLEGYRISYTGVDIQAGPNVDVVMQKPYRIPIASNSQDLVISGQAFEHIPFPFASFLEIARVLRPGGHVFLTAPSRGQRHYVYDLWRYYPDSMRAFAAYAELDLLEAYSDFPPLLNGRWNYAAIDVKYRYWGDTTGVFRKPQWHWSLRRIVNREVTLAYANHLRDLEGVPRPKRVRL
jgi:SAM-dependent methyltransferase